MAIYHDFSSLLNEAVVLCIHKSVCTYTPVCMVVSIYEYMPMHDNNVLHLRL